MKIKLTQKYKPFSHEEGTSLLLPKSPWKVTAYPAKVVLENLISTGKEESHTITPQIKGPLTQFTVMQDLERQWIRIFGRGPEGYFSYRLVATAHEITLFLERGPKEGIAFTYEGETKLLRRKEELIIPVVRSAFGQSLSEKMHFGCSKKQDWTLVKRRLSLEEILPIWHALGKHIPEHPLLDVGTAHYLKACQELVEQRDRAKIGSAFLTLFKVGFSGILSPSLMDETHHTFVPEGAPIPVEASPLLLLGEGARLIRRLLIEAKEDCFAVLPCLPKELHAGRFTDIALRDTLTIDLEWSKKLIRRVILHPKEDQEVKLTFQSAIDSFRLRRGRRNRGKAHNAGDTLTLKGGTLYILDRFQK
ncbi:hypothetical protein [Candidatus Neptunochlamydia vexilliferae]|uniref:hypothetical protein n=1 Tax=Candidatus Neptunichlamydia vexilliferae TaxID=1651774 RepID=UPI001890D87D|nr:hypothetical protein [Candidatus Neptunochlamydia vexilliferae]